jgi:putative acetyltransferase
VSGDIQMTGNVNIRWATEADYAQLGQVMFDAVRNGRSLYSEAQRTAWAPKPREGKSWAKRLEDQEIILQEHSSQVNGFMSLAPKGYIDFAYIRPSAQGSGLFRQLYDKIELRAVEKKFSRLWLHASLIAQPAFSAMGFVITKTEKVELSGQTFERFEMEKLMTTTNMQ